MSLTLMLAKLVFSRVHLVARDTRIPLVARVQLHMALDVLTTSKLLETDSALFIVDNSIWTEHAGDASLLHCSSSGAGGRRWHDGGLSHGDGVGDWRGCDGSVHTDVPLQDLPVGKEFVANWTLVGASVIGGHV